MIQFPVEIDYDEIERFRAPDNPLSEWAQKLIELNENGLSIDEEELFAYAVFVEWTNQPGWSTYTDLARKMPNRRARFEEYLESAEGRSIRLIRPPTRDVSEALGVGATLSLTAELLGLTNADFRKIRETSRRKTHDYEHPLRASTGSQIIRVEAKGTHDGKSVSSQRASIREKKHEERHRASQEGYTEALLGVICDLQYERLRGPTRLLVYDPPADLTLTDPSFVRLVNRLRYYSAELSRITRGHLAVALANRVRDVEALGKNWRDLDGLPLLSARGEPIAVYTSMADSLRTAFGGVFNGRLYDLRLTKSALRGTPRSVLEAPPRLYFRGLAHEVLTALAKQDFGALLRLHFPRRNYRMYGKFEGELHLLPSGLTVGILKPTWLRWDKERLPEIWRRLTGRSFKLDELPEGP
ncbi:MAG: hypothetical protein GY719_41850 [bacterium]|nr:hypothetical protein [bacterium]